MHLQKVSVYFCTQTSLPLFLYFWNYNPSPNGQIISLIDKSWGLKGTEYWRFFIVEYRQSYKLKKKSNFNPIYPIRFLGGFFYWKAIYKNAYKGLHKMCVDSSELFLECQSIWYFNRNTIFSRINIIFFRDAGNVIF